MFGTRRPSASETSHGGLPRRPGMATHTQHTGCHVTRTQITNISEQSDSAMAINTGIANISAYKLVTMYLKTRDKLHFYQALTQLPYQQKFDHSLL